MVSCLLFWYLNLIIIKFAFLLYGFSILKTVQVLSVESMTKAFALDHKNLVLSYAF